MPYTNNYSILCIRKFQEKAFNDISIFHLILRNHVIFAVAQKFFIRALLGKIVQNFCTLLNTDKNAKKNNYELAEHARS